MKQLSLLFLFGMMFCQANGQNDRERLQLKNIILTAYESVSQSSRQWLADATDRHPAGDFDTSYAKTKLNERFSFSQLSNTAEIMVCMMAYQKMLAKEAREDRKIQSHIKRLLLADKAAKLRMQNEAIDQGMKEAREKADLAMDAAATQLVIAISSGLLQIGSAAASYSGNGDERRQKKDSLNPGIRPAVIKPKLSVADFIKKLELQLAILKKG